LEKLSVATTEETEIEREVGRNEDQRQYVNELMFNLLQQLSQWEEENRKRMESISNRELQLQQFRAQLGTVCGEEKLLEMEKENSLKLFRITQKK